MSAGDYANDLAMGTALEHKRLYTAPMLGRYTLAGIYAVYSVRLRIVQYDIREAVNIAVHARLCVRKAVG